MGTASHYLTILIHEDWSGKMLLGITRAKADKKFTLVMPFFNQIYFHMLFGTYPISLE